MKNICLFVLVFGIAACDKIQTAYDKDIDFKQYKSFCWLEGCQFTYTGPNYLQDSILQENIKAAIITEMHAKGFRYDPDYPDLLVDFHITIENEKVITYHNREDEPYYYRMTFLTPQEVMLTKGSVLIHMVDRSQSIVVWQSQLLGYLENGPDISERNINRGIRRLLRDFPPDKEKG